MSKKAKLLITINIVLIVYNMLSIPFYTLYHLKLGSLFYVIKQFYYEQIYCNTVGFMPITIIFYYIMPIIFIYNSCMVIFFVKKHKTAALWIVLINIMTAYMAWRNLMVLSSRV